MIDLKEEVIKFTQKLNSTNLSPLRSGNVSVRTSSDGIEGFLITPSGKKYETLKAEDIVFLELNKEYDFLKIFNSGLNPSSEWRFHQDIYLKKKESKAIVHAHSPHATAVSAHGKAIPAFHYMVALAGGDDIKCAEYGTFGTKELSKNILNALEKKKSLSNVKPRTGCIRAKFKTSIRACRRSRKYLSSIHNCFKIRTTQDSFIF